MKRISIQALIGIILGTFIGLILSLVFSYLNGAKNYYPSSPAWTAQFSGTLSATCISVFIWSLIGIVFSVGALVFTRTDWSIAKMTIVHLTISYFGFLPLAILSGWFPLNIGRIIGFTGTFLVVYAIVFSINMLIAKNEVKSINRKLKNQS